MPIRFKCTTCGKNLRVEDEGAGQWINCPSCQAPLQVPQVQSPQMEAPAAAAEPTDVVDAENVETSEPPIAQPVAAADSPENRRPCPMCGEMIPVRAARCRFCGEVFDDDLDRPGRRRRRRRDNVDSSLSAGEWVLGILCSGIGCIVGLVYVLQGNPKGGKLLALSVVSAFVWNILYAIIMVAAEGGRHGGFR